MDFQVGDVVRTKKPHPCGCDTWEVLRVGADFRIRCTGCSHMVMLPRSRFEKSVKQNLSARERENSAQNSEK